MDKRESLIERIRYAIYTVLDEHAIPDKDFARPFYDYIETGRRELGSNGELQGMTFYMVPVFFHWICKVADKEDFMTFKNFCDNNEVLKGKVCPVMMRFAGEYRRTVELYHVKSDGSRERYSVKELKDDLHAMKGIFRQIAYAPGDGRQVLLYDKFYHWVRTDMDIQKGNLKDILPSNLIMYNAEPTDVEWMLHFTPTKENMMSIAKEGFKNGILSSPKSFKNMAYSKNVPAEMKTDGKLAYAYRAKDIMEDTFFDKYAKDFKERPFENSFDLKVWYNAIHYAVLFKANGIKVTHRTDMDDQVVFNRDTARDFIMICFKWNQDTDEKTWNVLSKDASRIIFSDHSLTKVVTWIVNNERQYHRTITSEKR